MVGSANFISEKVEFLNTLVCNSGVMTDDDERSLSIGIIAQNLKKLVGVSPRA